MSSIDHPLLHDPFFAGLAECVRTQTLARLQGVTGTHGLLLDAIGGFALQTPGLGRWVTLQAREQAGFVGPLRAEFDALPFCDNSFGAVVLRHLAGAGLRSDVLAREAARVLAPHGVLIVVECHPYSAWRSWSSAKAPRGESSLRAIPPRRWKESLRQAGLSVGQPTRCGAAWPGARATPRWMERIAGGAWLLRARKSHDATTLQRASVRQVRAALPDQASWLPGARRMRS